MRRIIPPTERSLSRSAVIVTRHSMAFPRRLVAGRMIWAWSLDFLPSVPPFCIRRETPRESAGRAASPAPIVRVLAARVPGIVRRRLSAVDRKTELARPPLSLVRPGKAESSADDCAEARAIASQSTHRLTWFRQVQLAAGDGTPELLGFLDQLTQSGLTELGCYSGALRTIEGSNARHCG
jgi:hypothetical protein